MPTSIFDSLRDLIRALELMQQPEGGAQSSQASEQTMPSIVQLGRRYEVVVWEVLMPHLIRNAPELAPETVSALQKTHQLEKDLLAALAPDKGQGLTKSRRATADRLAAVLGDTLGILETEVAAAFNALPEEQRLALVAIIEHELARVDGDDVEPDEGVSRAIDVLETDRSSLPIPAPPAQATLYGK